jgi:hypothetical protein
MNYTFTSETLSNGSTIYYKIFNGTAYHAATKNEVVNILEDARINSRKVRLRIHLGDPITGKPWSDKPENGYIGRSTGRIKIPLLIPRIDSMGGPGLLDDCIIRICEKKNGTYREVYKR